MATARATAAKTANAVKGIETSSAALAERFGIQIAKLPDTSRFDPDYGQAVQLEYLSNILGQIAAASSTVKIVNEAGDGFIEIPFSDFRPSSMSLWDDRIEPKGFVEVEKEKKAGKSK